MSRRLAVPLVLAALAGLTRPAQAGGYDTPMLYSARHIGMGGTAIGFVEDPSAMFHNPAGLGNIKRFSVLGDFSLLLARVTASPSPGALDRESELTVAPVFLVGAGLRLTDWLVAGLAVYPIASAGAKYEYPAGPDVEIENSTRLVFIETSPGLAFNLPYGVRLGAGYRITYVNLERFVGVRTAPNGTYDFKLDGFNLVGFRVGAQWTPVPGLGLGAVYRHRVETRVKGDSGWAFRQFTDPETRFLLPSKLGAGARYDIGDLGLAIDGEYLFNSQNEGYPLEGDTVPTDQMPSIRASVANVFDWSDEITVRAGVEFRFLEGMDDRKRLAARVGYVFDGKTTNERYPSAFGTPPGPTHVLTAGMGWNLGGWQLNAAYGRRFGKGDVTPEDVMAGAKSMERPCGFCGEAGMEPYEIGINGFYIDASFALP